jgi:hypothetical protein
MLLAARELDRSTDDGSLVRVMETAAHDRFRNANRPSGKAEGWNDALPAFNPHLDHQLLE